MTDYISRFTGEEIDERLELAKNAYQKPMAGIPKTDLNATVNLSLERADEATVRPYDSQSPNGMGYLVLEKDKTFASQVTATNTIYEIRYDFDLDNGSVTIPAGCELRFNGGKISNGTIVAANRLRANEWGFDDVTINGFVDFTSPLNVPVDNAKEYCETILAYKETTSVEPTVFVFGAGKRYDWDGVLYINRKNVSLIGGGTIEGTIHLGLTATEFTELNYGAYPATAHFNFVISGLRFSKYRVIGNSTDTTVITNYIKNATSDNDDNIAISLVNVCHVKISDCFFDNVPFPIVYTPNNTYVNQNVRRLNIENCDFERCHTGILATSITKSSIEYGDLIVNNCYFYPTHAGIDCDCIDGFKLYGSTFNTGANGVHPFNVKAIRAGQVVISHNSFYGEYNDFAVMLDDPGNACVSGNLFSAQSTAQGLQQTTIDTAAALIIRSKAAGHFCYCAEVVGNQFLNVEKPVMIQIEGDVRNITVDGNSMTLNQYLDSRRLMWNINVDSTRVNCLQPMRNSAFIASLFKNLSFKQEVNRDFLLDGNSSYYPNNAKDLLGGKQYWYNEKYATISKIEKYKPIFVVRFKPSDAPATETETNFYFNGIKYNVALSNSMSRADVFTAVINAISDDWSEDYNFQIIGNLLWIVGKTNRTPFYSTFICRDQNVNQALEPIYQNLGIRVEVKDADRKGFIVPDVGRLGSNYYGIDGDDDGKRIVFNGKNVTLKATNTAGAVGKLYFRNWTPPTAGFDAYLLDNDTFFAVDAGATETAAELVEAIVSLAYSDIFTVSGNNLTLIQAGVEFFFLSLLNFAWYWTWNGHVATYQFVSDDGRIYNPATDSFNDVGTTANRPAVANVRKGFVYFDETLGKCIVSNGTDWVNMDGTALS